MPNNQISKILDKSLGECFSYHTQHSAPNFPEQVRFVDAQKEFMATLTDDQCTVYLELQNNLLSDLETKENEFYYRLGFKDGLTAWRGA